MSPATPNFLESVRTRSYALSHVCVGYPPGLRLLVYYSVMYTTCILSCQESTPDLITFEPSVT